MTILVRVLTTITIVIGLNKVIGMKEPIITSFSRYLPQDEREARGAINFADLDFNIGFTEYVRSYDNKEYYQVPENIARIKATLSDYLNETPDIHLELKNC